MQIGHDGKTFGIHFRYEERWRDARAGVMHEHHEDFYEDVFEELSKYGEVENIGDNLSDHKVEVIQRFLYFISLFVLYEVRFQSLS